MDPIRHHPVNPSDISLFEDFNAKSTNQIMVEEYVGHPIGTYLMENKPNSSIPPMRQYWEDVSPVVRYQHPTDGYIWEQGYQLGAGPSHHINQQQQCSFRPVPPPYQMPMHHQFIQEKHEIIESDVYARRAPIRKIGGDRRTSFPWTYTAMIAAALLNSSGPQKMERLYAFVELTLLLVS